MTLAARYRNLPINYKIRLIISFDAAMALIVACTALLINDRAEYRSLMRSNLEVLADISASNSGAPLALWDSQAGTELLSALRAKRHISAAFILSVTGQPIASYLREQNSTPAVPPLRPDGSWFQADKLIVYRSILRNRQRIGALYLESDLGELHTRLVGFVWIALIILLVTCGVALAVFSKLQRIVSEPIAHLALLASTVTDKKDYSVRGVKHANDELGQLIDTFNKMLSEIEMNRDNLEGQVATRTAELVTARDKAEAASSALRISEERFRIASENASDLVFEWDLRSGQVQVFGVSANPLGVPVPRTFDEWKRMVHPDDVELEVSRIIQHIQNGQRYSGEYRVIGKDGRTHHYFSRGQAIRNPSGEPYRWIGVATDVTERKTAEEAISQLAAIVQCSEDAIIGVNLSGRIITWNGGAESLVGYAAADALGKPLSILFRGPEDARKILDTVAPEGMSRLDEALFLRKDGVEIPVSLTVSPIRKGSGETTGVAVIARDISERKKAEVELEHQARHDHLTGLPNRLLLADRLDASIHRASHSGLMTAVIYVDLDGFKFVNDTLGHEVGDALLQQVTVRLKGCTREPDTLARMGGDEFMLVINEVNDDQIASAMAERLLAALRTPFAIDSHELYMTASMGIAMYPRDGTDVSTLRRNADAAMYEAKHEGKDRCLFFTPAMRDMFLHRLELETELRRAIDRKELELDYQPIFDLESGRQTAFEALLPLAASQAGLYFAFHVYSHS